MKNQKSLFPLLAVLSLASYNNSDRLSSPDAPEVARDASAETPKSNGLIGDDGLVGGGQIIDGIRENRNPPASSVFVQRETVNGTVLGEHTHKEAISQRFRGIPYAKPPVGDLRFRPPEDADDYPGGSFDALSYAKPCIQSFYPHKPGPLASSEDCLYLNVWAPTNASAGTKKPVMFFIHGGGTGFGGADDTLSTLLSNLIIPSLGDTLVNFLAFLGLPLTETPIYDGHYLAGRKDVILVSINYRMGPLSSMYDPALGHGAGNFAYLDMKKALEWVQANIENFGGDKDNVTIFGESAGSWSVCALMNMPSARGLFHKGIMESQTCLSRTTDQAAIWANRYAENTGCKGSGDIATCLREADVTSFYGINPEVGAAIATWPYIPTIDGEVFPQWFGDSVQTSNFNHVPVMIGNNKAEAVLPLLTDGIMNCPLEANLEIFDEHLQAPIYVYKFAHHPFLAVVPVFHGSELPYVFGTAADMFWDRPRDLDVVEVVTSYWSNFAHTGSPNGTGLPNWPTYDRQTTREHLKLTAEPEVGSGSVIIRNLNCLSAKVLHKATMGDQIVFW